MTLAFLFVSLLTGRTLFGWVGISGGLSLMMRLLISALLVVWGAWRAWSQPVETKPSQTPNGTVILPSSARGWKTVRDWAVAIFFMILAWNAFITGWPKLIPLLRAWYGNRSSLVSQAATRDAATGALVAKLPGGSSIELLVLSEQAAAPDGWWLPDGTRLTNTRYEMRGPDVISPISGFAVKDILFRVIDVPRGANGPTIRFKSQVSSMRAGDLTVLSNGQTLTDAWPWRVALPEAVREETIGAGLGLEAWRTIYRTTPADWSSKSTPQPNDPYWKPSLHQVMDNAGNAQVTTTIQHPGENWFDRTVAVDTSGVEHEESSPGAGSGMGIRVIPKANERTWTYTFRDLPLTAVKEFRVQVRPVYWVEFRNVALQPREGVKPVALSQKFGPVMERTLNLHDTGYSDSLDLDTGKIVTPPKMETPWDWMTIVTLPAGIMVIPGTTKHPMMLAGTSTQVAPLPPRSDYWNGRIGLSDAQGAGIVKVVRGQTVTATAEGKSPQSFIFKTQSGQFGLLQITGFTDNLRAVKIRYKRVVNDAASSAQLSALAGGWEPAVTRGEQPDPEQVRNEANAFMQRGEFEESMRRHLWYHENAEKLVPGLSAVRRSFALSDWVELGRRYPKARQALVEVRDHKTHEISEGRGYFDLFTDVASINGYLQADRATCALFKQLQKADAALASQCYFAAEDALVKEREYAVCLEYIPNAQAKFEQLLQVWKLDRQNESKRPPLKGSTPPPNADSRLVTKIRQLIEILVGAGRKTEAQRILEQALDLVADPRLQSAVADAETRVKI